MQPILNIAVRAARAAGDLIVRYVDRLDALHVSSKGYNDFVTEVDREAERLIIENIHAAYPDHGILAEESGRSGNDEFQWVIDPLDGTTNFIHGFPQFAVSIALKHKQRLMQAVVFDPLRQEMFTASRGAGAQINERRIRVSKRTALKDALIGTGFPFRDMADLETYITTFRAVVTRTAGVRRAGAAALDLAYVAAGRLDGFWEFGLSEWDVAAGVLLIQESGGIVTEPDGGENYLSSGNIAAGTPKVLRALVQTLRPLLHAERRAAVPHTG